MNLLTSLWCESRARRFEFPMVPKGVALPCKPEPHDTVLRPLCPASGAKVRLFSTMVDHEMEEARPSHAVTRPNGFRPEQGVSSVDIRVDSTQ